MACDGKGHTTAHLLISINMFSNDVMEGTAEGVVHDKHLFTQRLGFSFCDNR